MEIYYMPRIMSNSKPKQGSKEAYALLSYMYYEQYGEKLPEIKKTANGKPYFPRRPEIHFSISHSKTHVLCAISNAPVGADIESPRKITPRAVRYFCTPDELRYFKPLELWVLKESFVKLRGGVLSDVKKYQFTRAGIEIITPDPRVRAKLFRIENDNCLIAVCTTGKLPNRADAITECRALPDYL